jgi:outer membrane lipoprotein-sorting protein
MKYLPKARITNNTIYARIDWKKPVEEQMSVIGDNYTLYRVRLSQVVKGSVKTGKGGTKAGSVLGLLTMSREEMKANYTYVYFGEETMPDGRVTGRVQLTPKNAASFQIADLWIDGDGMPRQVQITEKNKDTTKLLLTNIQKNIKIDPKVFEIKPPAGTKTIPG